MIDVIVVGGGIIGSTVTNLLALRKIPVLLADDLRPMGGTGPSGGHLKPSWFGMDKKDYGPALVLLDEAWGIKEEQFTVHPSRKTETIGRVDTDDVVRFRDRLACTNRVVSIKEAEKQPLVRFSSGREERCRLLLVAAGFWTTELLPDVTVTPKQGASFRFRGTLPAGNTIKPWAPYKQVTAHQQGPDEVWAGDGSALLPESWKDRTEVSKVRTRGLLRLKGEPIRTLEGLRPYCSPDREGDPCLFRKVGHAAYVATGAGKRGTIAAGWVAGKVLDALGC